MNKELFMEVMKKKGYNQSSLAKELELDDATMSRKINGVSKWNSEDLNKLAKVFGVNNIKLIFLS